MAYRVVINVENTRYTYFNHQKSTIMFSKWFKRAEKKEFDRRRTGKDQSCQHEIVENRKHRRRPVRPENCLRGARGANGTPDDFIIVNTPEAHREVGLLRRIVDGLFGPKDEQYN